MPRGDGTGPMGMGPMTGRAAGYCAGFSAPGFANPVPRMGMGFRRGTGFYGRGTGSGRGGGRGRGFVRGFGNYARGRGYGNFGQSMWSPGRTTPYVPVTYQAPNYPGYSDPYQYPSYQAQPAYGIW